MAKTGFLSPEERSIYWELILIVFVVNSLALLIFGLFNPLIGAAPTELVEWLGDYRPLAERPALQNIGLYFYALCLLIFHYAIGRFCQQLQVIFVPLAPAWLKNWYHFLGIIIGISGLYFSLNMLNMINFQTRDEMAAAFLQLQSELMFVNLLITLNYALSGILGWRGKTLPMWLFAAILACALVELLLVMWALQLNRPLFLWTMPNLIQGIFSMAVIVYLYLQLEKDRLWRDKISTES